MFHELSMATVCMEDHRYVGRPTTSEGMLLVATIRPRLGGSRTVVGHVRSSIYEAGRRELVCWMNELRNPVASIGAV